MNPNDDDDFWLGALASLIAVIAVVVMVYTLRMLGS